MEERLSVQEKDRIAQLVADGAPFWRIREEVPRSRFAIYRAIKSLTTPKPEPTRSPLRLSSGEREEISRGLSGGESLRSIAGRLGRAPSTIAREVRANGGARRYRAHAADRRAVRLTQRPKRGKLARCERLRAVVETKLELRWSPQQSSGWLVRVFPDDAEMRVSHETIYLSLFVQTRGELRKELTRHLRSKRSHRRRQGSPTKGHGQGQLRGIVPISERPPEADDRAVPGHWEGDLLVGKGNAAVATLVERTSRFVRLVGLPAGRTADIVGDALATTITGLPAQIWRSLAWDQGKEMAEHKRFSIATGLPVYFCDPHSPWQRGSNENTNGLLRQYLPKGSDLSIVTQQDLDLIAAELNGRPRRTLKFLTPSEVLAEALR